MVKRVCKNCGKMIDTDNDLYVLLGTYEGDRVVDETYFHMECWRRHFEERARLKAEAVTNGYQERMMPIAKQMIKKLKTAIGQSSGDDDNGGIVINEN